MNSDPGLMIGHDSFGSVEFNGTLFVDTDNDDDYVGLVFNYQSNRRFMLVAWKRGDGQYWNRRPFRATAGPGLQVKVIKSNTGPSDQLRNALWHEGNTAQQVCVCVSVRLQYIIMLNIEVGLQQLFIG